MEGTKVTLLLAVTNQMWVGEISQLGCLLSFCRGCSCKLVFFLQSLLYSHSYFLHRRISFPYFGPPISEVCKQRYWTDIFRYSPNPVSCSNNQVRDGLLMSTEPFNLQKTLHHSGLIDDSSKWTNSPLRSATQHYKRWNLALKHFQVIINTALPRLWG